MSLTVEIGVVVLWVAALLALQSLLNRLVIARRVGEFVARKIAHVAVGLGILPLALLVRRWQVAAIPITIIFAGNTKANQSRARLSRSLERVFPVLACAAPVAVVLYCWSRRRTDLVVLAVLAMSIGDTAAALVGRRFGRHKVPWTGKTLEGAAANFIASFATLALAGVWLYQLPPDRFLLPAAAVAIVEVVLRGEWDNPVAIMLLIGLLGISL